MIIEPKSGHADESAAKFIRTIEMIEPRPDVKRAAEIAIALRNDRKFEEVIAFTDRCIALGYTSATLKRINAHAQIETGRIAEALCILTSMRETLPESDPEYSQAVGLLGRANKQVYLASASADGKAYCDAALHNALRFYLEGMKLSNSDDDFVWHAVNVAALGKRAEVDMIRLAEPVDWRAAARAVVNHIAAPDRPERKTPWNYASAGEACLALDQPAEAVKWFSMYAEGCSASQYALHSIMRQLHTLWRLRADETPVGKVYAVLQARLLQVEKGELVLSAGEVASMPAAEQQSIEVLERVIGRGAFQIYEAFYKNLQKGKAIARIGRNEFTGFGTGFLVDGGDFHDAWKGKKLLLTNAHVVTDDRSLAGQETALHPDEAVATFTCGDVKTVHRVAELKWTSPWNELDATLLELSPPPAGDLLACELARELPPRALEGGRRPQIFILGHPQGGQLSISLYDNELIDYDAPPAAATADARVRIHYRAPTLPGSSGSPVFFGDDWRVIGLHHMSSDRFLPLSGNGEPYEGNEAIWIQSICRRTRALKRASKAKSWLGANW